MIVADVNVTGANETAEAVGGTAIYLDATKEEHLSDLAIGFDPDKVIFCAGAQIAASFKDISDADARRLFEVNTFGAIWTAKHLGRTLAYKTNHPSLTFVASVAGITSGGPGLSAYGASKAAVIGFTRSLAQELAPRVRVNAVAPGWTDTPFNDPVTTFMGGEKKREQIVELVVPMRRQADPDEIAAAVAFIASDDASYVTGHTLVADGGLTA